MAHRRASAELTGYETAGDSQSKRRVGQPRVYQACTRCRIRKTRCDGEIPNCSPCAGKGYSCVYSIVRKVRGTGKNKQRIEAMEGRLDTMESRLRSNTREDLACSIVSDASGLPSAPHISSQLSDPRGTSSTEGMGLPFDRISELSSLSHQRDFTKGLNRIVLSTMTPHTSDMLLVECALDDICAELPFLRIPWFLDQIRRRDALGVLDDWWQGLMNAMLASAVHFKAVTSDFREVAVYSWAFFRKAYAVLPELIIHADSLGAAQAVMAMAIFMRQSADTRTTALLLSLAIRMQHSAGLYTNVTTGSLSSTIEHESRNRLFWAAFILDMDMSMTTALPPVHTDQVGTVDLPGQQWLEGRSFSGLDPPARRDTVFRLRAELAGLQSRIATQISNPNQADFFALESEIEAWSLRIPLEIRPDWHEHPGNAGSAQPTDDSITMLHLMYYNSLSMLCWASVRHATTGKLHSHQIIDAGHEPHDRTSRHKTISRAAARAAIRALTRFPVQSLPGLWRALSCPLSASIVLLAVVCEEPTHHEAHGDLSLLGSFVQFLEKLVREGCDLQRMRDGVSKIEKVATDAVSAALATNMPVNPALWPLSLAGGHTGKAIAMLLTCSSYHPMYLAQSFMGNTPNRDTANAKQLAEVLGISWGKHSYGPFVPDLLMPATYGFAFGSSGRSSETPQ